MPYIGRGPSKSGAFRILDDISGSFNGSTTSFALTVGSAALTVGLPETLLIAVDGVIQEAGTAYTISGSNIVFGAAPQADATFWGVELGDVGGLADRAVTQAADDNTTKVATTAYVQTELSGISSSSSTISVTQSSHGLAVGDVVRPNGNNTYTKSLATTPANAEVIGVVTVVSGNDYTITINGEISVAAAVNDVAAGTVLFLSKDTAGELTATEPSATDEISKPVAIVTQQNAKMILVPFRREVISSNVQTNAPNDAQYVTLATNSTLTAERTLAGGTDLTLSDAGAGGAVTINHDDNFSGSAAQYTSATVTVNATGHITAIASGTAGPSQATQSAIEAETNEDTYVPPDLIKNSPGVAKAYCSVASDGTLQSNSYNVTSYARNSTGNYTVTWATDFANTNYSAHVNAEDSSYFARAGVPATGTQAVNIRNTSGAAADSAHNITAFGDQ